jgi:hypothetical protein
MISPNLREPAEKISSVIYDWLSAEVASSSQPDDVNSVLDDYDKAIEGLEGGFEHKYNFTWNKHSGHMDRLTADYNNLASVTPEDQIFNQLSAKFIFDGLMEVSGGYRNQCYAEAESQEDYTERRQNVIGVNIANIVKNCLNDLIPYGAGLSEARISIEGLEAKKDAAIKTGSTAIKKLVSIMTLKEDAERGAHEMINAQYSWLKLSVDSLVLVAKCKEGNLAKIPFLEPRSIGEQSGKIWYPFQTPLDWMDVMSANPPALKPGSSRV